jgi:hypothetical protein
MILILEPCGFLKSNNHLIMINDYYLLFNFYKKEHIVTQWLEAGILEPEKVPGAK